MLGINSCFLAQPSRRVTQWYFPGNTVVKNTPAKRHVYNPWVRKIPWSRKWQFTPVFLAGKFHGERTMAGYSPWVCKESDLTEHTHTCKQRLSNFTVLFSYACQWKTSPNRINKKQDFQEIFSKQNSQFQWWIKQNGSQAFLLSLFDLYFWIYYSVLSVVKFLKNLFNCLYTSQFVINEQSMYTQFL